MRNARSSRSMSEAIGSSCERTYNWTLGASAPGGCPELVASSRLIHLMVGMPREAAALLCRPVIQLAVGMSARCGSLFLVAPPRRALAPEQAGESGQAEQAGDQRQPPAGSRDAARVAAATRTGKRPSFRHPGHRSGRSGAFAPACLGDEPGRAVTFRLPGPVLSCTQE